MSTVMEAVILAPTALEVWQKWRKLSGSPRLGKRVFARSASVGEVFFMGSELCRTTTYPYFVAITNRQNDQVWDELCKGTLPIYWRRFAPIVGADEEPSEIIHSADGDPIPSGTLD